MSGDLSQLWARADRCLQTKQLAKAEQLYSEIIEKEGQASTERLSLAYNNRGQSKYLRVDFRGSIEDYSKAIAVERDQAVYYYNRGLVHYRMGRFEPGIRDFEEALRLDAKFVDSKIALATAKEELRRKTEKLKA